MAKTAYQVAGQIFYQEGGAGLIARGNKTVSLTIGSALAVTEEFEISAYAGGAIHMAGTSWTAANIGFQVSPTSGGDFTILYDDLGSPVQISGIGTAISGTYLLPDGLYNVVGYAKAWSKSATAATITDVNQDAERSLTVMLKG